MRILGYAINRLALPLYERKCITEYCGINLCDVSQRKTKGELFASKTKEALDLVRSLDKRRFGRIQKEIKFLVNSESYAGGLYCGGGKVCLIDFGRLDFAGDPDRCLYWYAGALVHEATHGTVFSKGIRTTRKNRMRIEKLCVVEENRFLAKVPPPYSDELRTTFNRRGWDFGSPLSKLRAILRRMGEEA